MRRRSRISLITLGVAAGVLTAGAAFGQQPTQPGPPPAPAPAPDPAQSPPVDPNAPPAATAPQAQPLPPPPPPKPKDHGLVEQWYGWQTLLGDGAGAALMIGGSLPPQLTVVSVGYLTFLFAPPIVHFTHGQVGKGFGDFGLRLITPWLFAGIGAIVGAVIDVDNAVKDTENNIQNAQNGQVTTQTQDTSKHTLFGGKTVFTNTETSTNTGIDIGLIAGWALCVGLDAAFLARENVKSGEADKEYTRVDDKKPWYTLRPIVVGDALHGTRVGVGGTF